MNNYYRVTYEDIGIYEVLKKQIWKVSEHPKEEWNKIKTSQEITWLKTPPYYSDKCESYFTQLGYDVFMNKTYNLLIKYLEKEKIEIKKYELNVNDIKIIYEDEHQIVIENK